MLNEYIDKVNGILSELIELTKDDLLNIKEAKHDGISESVDKKAKLSADFAIAKAELDRALIELSLSSDKELSELLSEEDKDKLALLKSYLQELHKLNKQYARLVLIIKGFYDRLLKAMFKNGDDKGLPTPSTLIKLEI